MTNFLQSCVGDFLYYWLLSQLLDNHTKETTREHKRVFLSRLQFIIIICRPAGFFKFLMVFSKTKQKTKNFSVSVLQICFWISYHEKVHSFEWVFFQSNKYELVIDIDSPRDGKIKPAWFCVILNFNWNSLVFSSRLPQKPTIVKESWNSVMERLWLTTKKYNCFVWLLDAKWSWKNCTPVLETSWVMILFMTRASCCAVFQNAGF